MKTKIRYSALLITSVVLLTGHSLAWAQQTASPAHAGSTVYPSVAAKSVNELIALAKSGAKPPTFASSGTGTISHLAGELFKRTAGVNMLHIPYKGGGQAITDLIGGHVQTGFVNILEALPNVKSGRLRALAVTSATRWPTVPDLVTVGESGLPGYEVVQWSGVLAPARTPRPIISKLHDEINAIINGPNVRELLIAGGAEPGAETTEDFWKFIKAEIARWSAVIKSSNIKIAAICPSGRAARKPDALQRAARRPHPGSYAFLARSQE